MNARVVDKVLCAKMLKQLLERRFAGLALSQYNL
jgi:hypothetical protein